jgi:hypothetical protein
MSEWRGNLFLPDTIAGIEAGRPVEAEAVWEYVIEAGTRVQVKKDDGPWLWYTTRETLYFPEPVESHREELRFGTGRWIIKTNRTDAPLRRKKS